MKKKQREVNTVLDTVNIALALGTCLLDSHEGARAITSRLDKDIKYFLKSRTRIINLNTS